jgi:hypothetical protein
MIPKRITVTWLRRRSACEDQISIFKGEWPQGAILSRENLLRAAELGLDLDWLAQEILNAPLWEAYEKAYAPLREAYEKAYAPLWEAYEKAYALLREAYEKAYAPLLADAIEGV